MLSPNRRTLVGLWGQQEKEGKGGEEGEQKKKIGKKKRKRKKKKEKRKRKKKRKKEKEKRKRKKKEKNNPGKDRRTVDQHPQHIHERHAVTGQQRERSQEAYFVLLFHFVVQFT